LTLWIDAQLSPALAPWATETIPELSAFSLKWLDLRDATDLEVFMAAREQGAVVLTKDVDFVDLLVRHGPPPQVIWLTCGNTSNLFIKEMLLARMPVAIKLLARGEALVEIR
jgi:predicted nuclease of predicted toxin-antitoxin system